MLAAGELYSIDHDGNTPLFYALVLDNADCVGVIFSHFEDDPRRFLLTPREVVFLLRHKTGMAKDFLQLSFASWAFPRVEEDSPIQLYPELMPHFLMTGRYNYESLGEGKNTEAYISSFWYNNMMGSQDSLGILFALKCVKSDSVWETPFVQSLLDIKWTMVYKYLLIQAALYYVYLVLATVYATEYTDNTVFQVIMLLLTLLNVG